MQSRMNKLLPVASTLLFVDIIYGHRIMRFSSEYTDIVALIRRKRRI